MKDFDTISLDSEEQISLDPSQWTRTLPVTFDRDWDEACRIAEMLGFGADAVKARKRTGRRPEEARVDLKARLSEAECLRWSGKQAEILKELRGGHWPRLCALLADCARQAHPFDPATFQQLHYIACTLACEQRAAIPEQDRHEGGTLAQALYDLCKLVQVAPEEDVEWAFEQGLEDLSPYLVGDRSGEVCLLEPVTLPADRLTEHLLAGLNERLVLGKRVGSRFAGAQLYLELKQRPWNQVSEGEFLRLSELAGDQAFFHSFLGRQELVHWRHHDGSIKSAFQHLWRAYVQEIEYIEEPRIDIGWLGDGSLEIGTDAQLQVALRDGLGYLRQALDTSLAADRFLRHLWRKFLSRYDQALARIEHMDCLRVLLRVREALADEIDAALEFVVAGLSCKLKQWQYVEECYLKGLALDPGNIEEMLNLAHFYKGRNRYQEARTLFTKVLKLKPGDATLLQNLRGVADRLDLQHQFSPFLTDNPKAAPVPPRDLEDLDAESLLAVAAMVHGLDIDQGGHLRAFGEASAPVFPHRSVQASMLRQLLESGALLVYRYSPECSYRLQGALFDFDMDSVEWMLNVQSSTYPDLAPCEAATEILRSRLEQDWRSLAALWRQVASHDLLEHAQYRFDTERWNLNTSDYVFEVVGALLESLSLRRALWLIDEAVERTRREVAEQAVPHRQVTQAVLRNIHGCYEKAIFSEQALRGSEIRPESESAWSRLFRARITRLGSLYYDAAPGEVQIVPAVAF